jgi:hypothetical protein
MDVSLGVGWTGQQPYCCVTFENNVFGHSTNGSGWHYYGLAWYLDLIRDMRVVGNTFENGVYMDTDHSGPAPYTGVWANNIGVGWHCFQGVTYRNNLGTKCHDSDIQQAFADLSSNWMNPSANDFHLKSTSRAINLGSATYASPTDRDGRTRVGAPDAGAYEYR